MKFKKPRRPIVSAAHLGRGAFRGMYQPLILSGQALPSLTNVYGSSTTDTSKYDPADATSFKDPCKLNAMEQAYCQFDNSFSFCSKARLTSDDPKCIPSTLFCPFTTVYAEACTPGTELNKLYGNLCTESYMGNQRPATWGNKCMNDVITETEDDFNKKKNDDFNKKKNEEEEKKKREGVQENIDRWKRMRGCKYRIQRSKALEDMMNAQGFDLNSMISPCPFSFGDRKPGDDLIVGANTYKFLGWVPEQP